MLIFFIGNPKPGFASIKDFYFARGVDEPVAVARHDDAAGAFEERVRVELFGEVLRHREPVGLDIRGLQPQQPRRFGRVGRDQRLGAAPGAGQAKFDIRRHHVERVGVEHAGNVARERRAQQRLGAFAAHDGGDGRPIEVSEHPGAQETPACAQHEEERERVGRPARERAVEIREQRRHPNVDRAFDRDVEEERERETERVRIADQAQALAEIDRLGSDRLGLGVP